MDKYKEYIAAKSKELSQVKDSHVCSQHVQEAHQDLNTISPSLTPAFLHLIFIMIAMNFVPPYVSYPYNSHLYEYGSQ